MTLSPLRSTGILAAVAMAMLLLAVVASASEAGETTLRGVRKRDMHLYNVERFKCRGSERIIPPSLINDDFCDCEDGSDEPGTNACANGVFYCQNKGHVGQDIPSSRVNDGICDCCDGSDEYAGASQCSNTCDEAGREERERKEREMAAVEAGSAIKQEWIARAKVTVAERASKLAALQAELSAHEESLEAARVKKEAEEEAERLENERREKEAFEKVAEEKAKRGESKPDSEASSDHTQSATANSDAPTSTDSVAEGSTESEQEVEANMDAAEPEENFPYPKEYAFDASKAEESDDAANSEDAAEENFPYPKEYAYDAAAAEGEGAATENSAVAMDEPVYADEADEEEDDTPDWIKWTSQGTFLVVSVSFLFSLLLAFLSSPLSPFLFLFLFLSK